MRIVSLGKFLDDRRPIDHDEGINILESLSSKSHSSRFGVKEFNECKAKFQLSIVARTQLYIRAAQGIQDTQQALGRKIDELFHGEKDNILLVGACLRRLGLEYRRRLERYRYFHSGKRAASVSWAR
jgi:hypothetical protein